MLKLKAWLISISLSGVAIATTTLSHKFKSYSSNGREEGGKHKSHWHGDNDRCERSCDSRFFGPMKFIRTKGEKDVYTLPIAAPAGSSPPYQLHILNGKSKRHSRVTSAWVYVDDALIAGPEDFKRKVRELVRSVSLTDQSVLNVVLAGKPGSFLVIEGCGAKEDSADITAPGIAVAEPAANSLLNSGAPRIRLAYSDPRIGDGRPVSGVNPASLSVLVDGQSMTSLFQVGPSEAEIRWPAGAGLSDGFHTVEASIADSAGNVGRTRSEFTLDATAPAIAASRNPPPNGSNWNNADVTVGFSCTDGGSGVAFCTPPRVVTTESSGSPISGLARDHAGNEAQAAVTVRLDKTGPELGVTNFPESTLVHVPAVEIKGFSRDTLSGLSFVSCNGNAAIPAADAFSCLLSLMVGENKILVTAGDSADNEVEAIVKVIYEPNRAPVVNVGSDDTVLFFDTTSLSGTVLDDGFPDPPGKVALSWSQISGVGSAVFSDSTSANSGVTFSDPGSYVLRLTAFDGAVESSDTLILHAKPASCDGLDDGDPCTKDSCDSRLGVSRTPIKVGATRTRITGLGIADEFSGPELKNTWNPNAIGVVPTYSLSGSGLEITDAAFAVRPGHPGESWIVDMDEDLGNQMSWPVPIGQSDFDLEFDFGWETTIPEIMMAGVALTNAQNQMEMRAGVWDGRDIPSLGLGYSFAAIREPGTGGNDKSWYGPEAQTTTPTGRHKMRFTRKGGVLTLLNDGVVVQTWPFAADIRNLAIFTVRYKKASGETYPFATFRLHSLSLCWFPKVVVQDSLCPFRNTPPLVEAGPDQAILVSSRALLQGTFEDDGLPNPPGALTYSWSKVDGPGDVSISNPDGISNTASFSAPGRYIVRFQASDGEFSVSDESIIEVIDPCQSIPSGAISWWPGDGDYRDRIATNHGSGGSESSFGPGRRGQAFRFNGIGTLVSVPHHQSLSLPESFSVELWFSPTVDILPSDLASPRLFTKGITNSLGIANASVTNNSPGGYFEVRGPSPRPITNSRQWASGLWYHAVVTFGGGAYRIFINGIQESHLGSTPSIFGNSEGIHFGGYSDPGLVQNFFNGSIDDIRIYNRPLSPEEIWRLFVGSQSCPMPNQTPVVKAGPDQVITLPSSVHLQGTAVDDGLPNPPGALTYAWSKLNGPGIVTFSDSNAAATSASFSQSGNYSLLLVVSDSQLSDSDTVIIAILPPPSSSPPFAEGDTLTIVANESDTNAPVVIDPRFNVLKTYNVPFPLAIELSPPGSAFGPYLYVSSFPPANAGVFTIPDTIFRIDTGTADLETFFTLPGESDIANIEFGSGGEYGRNLYLCANNRDGGRSGDFGGAISMLEADPAIRGEILVTPLSPNYLSEPNSMAFSHGLGWGHSLFVTNTTDPPFEITRVRADGGKSTFVPMNTGSIYPALRFVTDTAFPSGLFISSIPNNPTIQVLDSLGNSRHFATLSGVSDLGGMRFNRSGELPRGLFVTARSGARLEVHLLDAAGRPMLFAKGFWGNDPTNPQSTASWDELEVDEHGKFLYVADYWRGAVFRIGRDPGLTPFSVAANDGDPDGDLLRFALVTGPSQGAVHLEPDGSLFYRPDPGFVGTDSLTYLAADSAGLSDTARVVIAVIRNLAPVVNAGSDQALTLPASAALQGSVTDDGQPSGTLMTAWRKLDGPGAVTFGNPAQAVTTASFSISGSYRIVLRGSDGQLAAEDTVAITVIPTPVNQPPLVSAGPDLEITLPACAQLQGSVQDDGLPANQSLFIQWFCSEGTQLADASQPATQACFSQEAIYGCILVASDGEFQVQDTTFITVNPEVVNQPPSVFAGVDQIITVPDSASLVGTAQDDGLPNPPGTLSFHWEGISGPAPVAFTAPLSASTKAVFTQDGSYLIRLIVSDGSLGDTDSVAITVRSVQPNQPPSVFAGNDQAVVLPAMATLSGTASDDGLPRPPGLTYSWSQISGPDSIVFGNPTSQTTTITFNSPGRYLFQLSVSDGEFSDSDQVEVIAAIPSDGAFPTAAIINPVEAALITEPIPVIGTAGDANLREYILEACQPTGPPCREFARGLTSITNGTLGTFDPTLLPNGLYAIRLTVTDFANQSSQVSVGVILDGGMKLGQLNFAKTDLSLKAQGMDLALVREYDSRRTDGGDFGPGWHLAHKSVQVAANTALGQDWTQIEGERCTFNVCIPEFRILEQRIHEMVIRLSDAEVERFGISLSPSVNLGARIEEVTVSFVPLGKTLGSLEALDAPSTLLFNEGLFTSGGEAYNPQRFRLTRRDGTVYIVDASAGLVSMTDPFGNSVTYGENGIQHSSGAGISFERGEGNRIVRATDNQGRIIRYEYADGVLARVVQEGAGLPGPNILEQYGFLPESQQRRLKTIRAPDGRELGSFEYDGNGRMTGLIDAEGNRVLYGYDLANHRQCVTDRLGQESCYEYDNRGNVTRKSDPLGNVTTYEYDSRDNLTRETSPTGVSTSKTYNAAGDMLTETDGLGNTTTFTYDDAGRVTRTENPLGHVTLNAYDAKGNLDSTTDAMGLVTKYGYDSAGNQTSMRDAAGNVTFSVYDASGNLTRQIDAQGHAADFTFDAYGNQLSETRYRVVNGDTAPVITRNVYDAQNRLIKSYDSNGDSTSTEYDALGKQNATVDKVGRRTGFKYDAQGNQVKVIHPDGSSDSTEYDAEGRRIASIDRVGRKTRFEYDALGRLVRTVFPDNTSTSTEYDALGRTVFTIDAAGSITTYEYENGCGCSNRRTAVINALGQITRFEYDAAGNQTAVEDGRGMLTGFVYDALNRRIRTLYADGTSDSTGYDAVGRNVFKRDQAGVITRYEYDALGRLIKVIDALNGETRYGYDEMGNQISQIDALGRVTRFEYDNLGRRIHRILPMGQAESYAYNAAGNMVSKTDFNGRTTNFVHDTLGRLVRKIPDSFFAGDPGVTFTYTPSGQRATMADASGTTNYQYDGRDRLIRKVTPQGTLFYGYDGPGRLASIRSEADSGVSVEYAYDVLGRLREARDNRLASGVTSYAYNAVGGLESYAYPNGVTHRYAYDNLNRLTRLDVDGSTISLARYVYALGPTGNRLSVAELNGRFVQYNYDNLYRLTRENISGDSDATLNGEIGYVYDAVGNRRSRTSTVGPVPSATYDYNDNDQLLSDSYDANGNTTVSGGRNFTWNFENRLVGMDSGDVHVTMVYNGDGDRVAKTVGGVTTTFLVDNLNLTGYAQVLEEWQGGGVTRIYAYGLDLISQRQVVEGEWRSQFYGYDGHGSIALLTNEGGGRTDGYEYEAFGIVIRKVGETPNNFQYTGEQFDPDISQYYLRARYYNNIFGRFISQDKYEGDFGNPNSLHKYLYGNNNSVNSLDPSGNFSITSVVAAAAILGIISSNAAASPSAKFEGEAWESKNKWDQSDMENFRNFIAANHFSYVGSSIDCANLAITFLVDFASANRLPVRLYRNNSLFIDSKKTLFNSKNEFLDQALILQAKDIYNDNTSAKGVLPSDINKGDRGDLMMGLFNGNGFTGHTRILVSKLYYGPTPSDYRVRIIQGHLRGIPVDIGFGWVSDVIKVTSGNTLWYTNSLRWWQSKVFFNQ